MKQGGTVSVLAARPVVEELQRRDIDDGPVLRAAQFLREALASSENRLPHENVHRLWELAAGAARDRSLGIHVAETLPRGGYELLEYMLSAAATVGEGIAHVSRYTRLIHDESDWHLFVEPRWARLVCHVPVSAPQMDEFALTLLLVRSREACGTRWTPERMRFQHERPDDDGELARVFGCPIELGAAETEMQVATAVLELPHTRRDSRLLGVLLRYADSILATLPSHGDVVASVSAAIARQLAKGPPSLASTAGAVHLPERTLQRRLSDKGTSHSSLLDAIRRELALRYIGDAALSVAEISYLLHFSDATAFHRAFKRWTGVAPVQYRGRLFESSTPAS